jgi:hypothetical protein
VVLLLFRIWHSNSVVRSQFSVKLRVFVARHFNRFSFLHQLKEFPNHVSKIARAFLL